MHMTTDTQDRAFPTATPSSRRLGEGNSPHILLALDGSHLAATALPYAVALAHATEARLTLLAVVEPTSQYADMPSAASLPFPCVAVAPPIAAPFPLSLPSGHGGHRAVTAVPAGSPPVPERAEG